MLEIVTHPLTLTVLTAVLSGIGWLFHRLYRTRRGHQIISRLGAYAETAVLATYAEYVSEIRKGRADGVLTPEERKYARREALSKLWTYADLSALARILGESQAEALASDTVEAALLASKASGLIPGGNLGPLSDGDSTESKQD